MIKLITTMACISLGFASLSMAQDVVISENSECDADTQLMVTCPAADQSVARNILIADAVTINSLTWGASSTETVEVNIVFSTATGGGSPADEVLTQVGTATQEITASGLFYDTPVDIPFGVDPGTYLVVEIFYGPSAGNIYPAGSVSSTGITYIMAEQCNILTYTDVALVGDFSGAHVIMCLNATLGDFDPCTVPLPAVCAADVDMDGSVAVSDVLAIIGAWGDCGDGTYRPTGDIAPMPNGDCCVTVADVLAVVGSWGADCTVYGACCYGDGMCDDMSNADDCAAVGGSYFGDDSMCADGSCVAAACCLDAATCSDLTEDACASFGGTYKGDGTACATTDCAAVEAGDECTAAIAVVDGANAFDTTNMTAGGSTPDDTQCAGTYLDWGASQDGWYMYVATGGMTTFDTCDATSHDTSMVLYEGSCDNQVACNGDSTNQTTCQSFYSEITNYDCVAGETYYIRLGQYTGIGAGPGTLNITPPATGFGACCFANETCIDDDAANCTAFGGFFQGDGTDCSTGLCEAGPGDECSSATEAMLGANAYDTSTATASVPNPDESLCEGTFLGWPVGGSPDMWMYWVATDSGTATFDTCDVASFDTSIVLYEGTCDNQISCDGDTGAADCQAYSSIMADIQVTQGTTYFIRLGGWGGATGPGTLNISFVGGDIVGACCMTDGSCMDYNSVDCNAVGGSWDSTVICADANCPQPYAGCPADSVDEGAPCFVDGDDSNSDINGGPLVVPAAYGSLTAGTPLCGTVSVYMDISGEGPYRDMDLYLIDGLDLGGQMTIAVGNSGFNMNFGVLELNPVGAEPGLYGVVGAFYTQPAGFEDSVTFDLPVLTGERYMIGVFPSEWDTSLICGNGLNEYHIQVD